ncbi:protein suppressor of sable [Phymastichus coffea]|uniref:protein suppressor of sable n=1 Tax=Phymastichus coffea TaxID=108790 RepID=UPI00273C5E77|nr:protein suppressor of sable [Phymastichus coffea]
MALESVSAVETAIQSNADDNDLEDGEIPSDEDDEPAQPPPIQPNRLSPELAAKEIIPLNKTESSPKHKSFDKFAKSKSKSPTSGTDRLNRQKSAASDDFAGDVEKAIRAALDEDRGKYEKARNKNDKSSKARSRKRSHDKDDERARDQKKKRTSDDENGNEDDDEMLFVRGASPVRRGSHESSPVRRDDCYNSGSDYDDRNISNRHRDDSKRGGARWSQDRNKQPPLSVAAARRNVKQNDRLGNKAGIKARMQLRGERNNRRNQNDHAYQDPDAICVYYMQGKCHRGDDCPFSHNALPPRKMELCKFYLMDCCAKRDKCLYMHHDFPCKFFHTGSKCVAGENCKFSHQPMSEQVKNILLKHLETAPKEILGNFPRLSREGALHMINMTEKQLTGHDAPRIPSLFDLKVSNSFDTTHINDHGNNEMDDHKHTHKDRKSLKKTRWGSDDDRVPLDVLNKFALLGKESSGTAVNFYNENDSKVKERDEREREERPKTKDLASLNAIPKDVDLRQLLRPKTPKTVNVTDEVANSAMAKMEEGNDRDEDTSLVIETPTDDEDKSKTRVSPSLGSQIIPSSLSKKTQELFMRIQQQQKEQEDSFKNLDNNEDQHVNEEDWYSDDDDDDDDYQLTIVDFEKEKEEEEQKLKTEEEPLQQSGIPQPAPFVDSKLGDLSKIDISMEVSKLLSSIKAQSNQKQEKEALKTRQESTEIDTKPELPLTNRVLESEHSDPKMSPSSNILQSTTVSRDPRMSRDPRQRRDEPRQPLLGAATPVAKTDPKDARSMRLEMSIYSSGIIAEDAIMDVDLRAKLDHDHRRKDMDLRCFPPGQSFGDTDLRLGVGGYNVDTPKGGDVDLRMLSMSFKPVPSHVPCTELEAGITSHPPIPYKVYVIDVPRPDYTGLKISKNDPQVQYDPRLRKILRISDVPESPMSPPPVKMLDTPKSPPLVRTDPRRKALEAATQPKIIPTTVQQHAVQEHPNIGGMPMGMSSSYMQNPTAIPVQSIGSSMGPQPLMGAPMLGGMGPMMRDGPVLSREMPVIGRDVPVMGGNGGSSMGPPNMRMGSRMQQHPGPQSQMRDYGDPRYNSRGENNVGLLGPGPQQMGGYRDDPRSQFDGPPGRYPVDNYDNYGNGPNMGRGELRMERGFNGGLDESNFSGNSDWGGNQGRMNRKDRRRTTRGKFGGLLKRKD